MNQLDNDALIHILTSLPKDDLSAVCCTARAKRAHTTLIDLHEEHTPDDVVRANLYENVCAAFKRLTV